MFATGSAMESFFGDEDSLSSLRGHRVDRKELHNLCRGPTVRMES